MADVWKMKPEELIAVIRAAAIPLFGEEKFRRLQFLDKKTLQRLTFLVRRAVQNQGY